jgi:DNA-binding winged helix-turn-helix (wHTH) protein/predicted ATPase
MPSAPHWCFGAFRLDPETACLWQAEQLLPLSPRPFAVLAYLVARAGKVVTKDELLEAVWPETAVSEGVLKTCLGQIRQVLGETARTPQYIATVHRRGYRFIAPVTTLVFPTTPTHPLRQHIIPEPSRGNLQSAGLCPPAMVARDTELAQLHQCWEQARQGRRQIVFIIGEAGIGKTTLVDAFVAQVAATETVWFSRGQCIEQYGSGEAYLPLLEALGQLGRDSDGASVVATLLQQAPGWLLQIPALLSAADYQLLQQRHHGTTRDRMLRELTEAVEALTTIRPMVLVVEDLHWSDYATLDWLTYMARHRGAARLLVLGTYRPVDAIVRAHPVRTVTQELQRQGRSTTLLLPMLPEAAVAAYLAQRCGAAQFAEGLVRLLHQRTNGHPFFLATVIEGLMRQGSLVPQDQGWVLQHDLEAVAMGVPESVGQLLDYQLAQVSPAEQELLTAASVAGIEFSAAAVAAGVGQTTENVEASYDALAHRGQFVQSHGITEWPDGTVTARYRFLHDLYHEVLYNRVPVSRRMRWHRQIGARLEAGYGAQAREFAAELAMHFLRGRDVPKAVQYCHYAGEQALQRSAHQEAISHLTRGLDLLQQLPENLERAQQELGMQIALGSALKATKDLGAPDVEHAYLRARELSQQLGGPSQIFPALYSLYELYEYRGMFHRSQALGEELLHMAHQRHDATLLLGAYETLSCTAFHLGAFPQVLEHTEHGLILYEPQQHRALASLYGKDLGVSSRYWSAMALWFLGYPDRALQEVNASLSLARNLRHPYSVTAALNRAACLGQFRRESHATLQWAEAAVATAAEHGFPRHTAVGSIFRGWALAMQGRGEEGIAQIHQGLVAYRKLGMAMEDSYFLALLAEAHGSSGGVEEGLVTLAEALSLLPSERDFFCKAELYRLQGEMLLHQAVRDEQQAETCFNRARTIAQHQ